MNNRNNRVRVIRISPGERIVILGVRRHRNHRNHGCRRCNRM